MAPGRVLGPGQSPLPDRLLRSLQQRGWAEAAFETPWAPEAPLPPYAYKARPVALRSTGTMDPIAQQIIAGLAPHFQDLKAAMTGPKGWEALGESVATLINRGVQPVTPGTPSQGPLPALVAPDPPLRAQGPGGPWSPLAPGPRASSARGPGRGDRRP